MNVKNWTLALLVVTVVLTKKLAFGCKTCNSPVGNCKDYDGGFFNIDHPFGSFFRKLSPLFAPGIQRVLTY